MLTVGATQGFSEIDHIVLYFAETVSAVLSGLPANHFPSQTVSFFCTTVSTQMALPSSLQVKSGGETF